MTDHLGRLIFGIVYGNATRDGDAIVGGLTRKLA